VVRLHVSRLIGPRPDPWKSYSPSQEATLETLGEALGDALTNANSQVYGVDHRTFGLDLLLVTRAGMMSELRDGCANSDNPVVKAGADLHNLPWHIRPISGTSTYWSMGYWPGSATANANVFRPKIGVVIKPNFDPPKFKQANSAPNKLRDLVPLGTQLNLLRWRDRTFADIVCRFLLVQGLGVERTNRIHRRVKWPDDAIAARANEMVRFIVDGPEQSELSDPGFEVGYGEPSDDELLMTEGIGRFGVKPKLLTAIPKYVDDDKELVREAFISDTLADARTLADGRPLPQNPGLPWL
jgi:hypothetical protein